MIPHLAGCKLEPAVTMCKRWNYYHRRRIWREQRSMASYGVVCRRSSSKIIVAYKTSIVPVVEELKNHRSTASSTATTQTQHTSHNLPQWLLHLFPRPGSPSCLSSSFPRPTLKTRAALLEATLTSPSGSCSSPAAPMEAPTRSPVTS